MVTSNLRQKIKKLWQNPSIEGSFTGPKTFNLCLRRRNIKIKESELRIILSEIPGYLQNIQRKQRFPRRPYNVYGVRTLMQSDLMEMPVYDGFRYALISIDVYSRRIFGTLLKKKTASAVQNAFKALFDKYPNFKPFKLETDQGQEFMANQKFFEKNNIFFKIKLGNHKACFAEHAIFLIKRKLYLCMRQKLSKNWPLYFSDIISSLNFTPNPSIGFLRPADIYGPIDDPLIAKEKRLHPLPTTKKGEPRKPRLLPVGSYVYRSLKKIAFDKSYDIQQGQLYVIKFIDSVSTPPLYILDDLNGKRVKGRYYREQLVKSPPPEPGHLFEVEKILKTRKRAGKLEYLVKFLFYPKEFNQWLPKENFVSGKDGSKK